jgi:hypothetical protein
MMAVARVKLRIDFNGNRIGQPEIIETLIHCNDGLDKLAKIYARMIKNDLEDRLINPGTVQQTRERKSS